MSARLVSSRRGGSLATPELAASFDRRGEARAVGAASAVPALLADLESALEPAAEGLPQHALTPNEGMERAGPAGASASATRRVSIWRPRWGARLDGADRELQHRGGLVVGHSLEIMEKHDHGQLLGQRFERAINRGDALSVEGSVFLLFRDGHALEDLRGHRDTGLGAAVAPVEVDAEVPRQAKSPGDQRHVAAVLAQ